MKIKMLVDAPGSPDGVTVNEYAEGEEYDVTPALGVAFIDHGLATPVGKATKKASGPAENK